LKQGSKSAGSAPGWAAAFASAGWVVGDETGDVSPGVVDGWVVRIGTETYGSSSEGQLLRHNVIP
tara:strand:+ start:5055 stop:5249 length:195 start_codon:yes stop_codon:yes gene_type:complete